MYIFGVTGKSGTGKSTFSKLLSEKYINYKIVNIDKLGHLALKEETVLNGLTKEFGIGILNTDGSINRKKLGEFVFLNSTNMDYLTELTWGFMEKEINIILDNNNTNVVILEWILLPTVELWNKCDTKILLHSDDLERKNKVLERDNVSEEYFNKRDNSSVDYSTYHFDYIIKNNYIDDELELIVHNIYNELSLPKED